MLTTSGKRREVMFDGAVAAAPERRGPLWRLLPPTGSSVHTPILACTLSVAISLSTHTFTKNTGNKAATVPRYF